MSEEKPRFLQTEDWDYLWSEVEWFAKIRDEKGDDTKGYEHRLFKLVEYLCSAISDTHNASVDLKESFAKDVVNLKADCSGLVKENEHLRVILKDINKRSWIKE